MRKILSTSSIHIWKDAAMPVQPLKYYSFIFHIEMVENKVNSQLPQRRNKQPLNCAARVSTKCDLIYRYAIWHLRLLSSVIIRTKWALLKKRIVYLLCLFMAQAQIHTCRNTRLFLYIYIRLSLPFRLITPLSFGRTVKSTYKRHDNCTHCTRICSLCLHCIHMTFVQSIIKI